MCAGHGEPAQAEGDANGRPCSGLARRRARRSPRLPWTHGRSCDRFQSGAEGFASLVRSQPRLAWIGRVRRRRHVTDSCDAAGFTVHPAARGGAATNHALGGMGARYVTPQTTSEVVVNALYRGTRCTRLVPGC